MLAIHDSIMCQEHSQLGLSKSMATASLSCDTIIIFSMAPREAKAHIHLRPAIFGSQVSLLSFLFLGTDSYLASEHILSPG